ncbi:hypothetical protein E2C01_076288 [Portunus trituberculatus]|uniref:Uncharacterized protein n=1 Tax=Portunus trituberculatus TaxID=210409 RepID=A0A5B7IB28_PORTR|nr:hypothetical protein [Portunus trituberculatus]
MADSNVRGSEMSGDAKETSVRMDNMEQKMSSEMKKETSAVVIRMDLKREEMVTAVGEVKQFTVEHSKRLRQDLMEEFREELVAVRQQCKRHTEVVETKVEEVTRLVLPGEAVSWHVGTV